MALADEVWPVKPGDRCEARCNDLGGAAEGRTAVDRYHPEDAGQTLFIDQARADTE